MKRMACIDAFWKKYLQVIRKKMERSGRRLIQKAKMIRETGGDEG